MAIQNLFWGLGTPFFGAIADRFGTWRVLALSGIFYTGGLVLMAFADTPLWLHIGGGVLVGLGIASGSFGIVLAAFARNVAPSQRSMVFGFGTAAGSAGMFVFAPLSQGLIDAVGWKDALVWLGVLMLVIPVLAIPLRGNASSGTQGQAAYEQSVREALREALGHQSYLLLVSGFFVCGFQVAFITAHFPAFLGDIGIAPGYAVLALALIGLFNIAGSLGAGYIGQRHSKPIFLALIYIARSVVITAFLLTTAFARSGDRVRGCDGPAVAFDRAADERAGGDHVRHKASRPARAASYSCRTSSARSSACGSAAICATSPGRTTSSGGWR